MQAPVRRINSQPHKDLLRIDVLYKKMLRGFRKVVFAFIDHAVAANPQVAKLVDDLRVTNGKKKCAKSMHVAYWIDMLTDDFELDEDARLDLTAVFVKFIFKNKRKSFVSKISDGHPARFSCSDIEDRINKFW